jgi:hypothetical protein
LHAHIHADPRLHALIPAHEAAIPASVARAHNQTPGIIDLGRGGLAAGDSGDNKQHGEKSEFSNSIHV